MACGASASWWAPRLAGLVATQGVAVRSHLIGVAVVATIIAIFLTRWLLVDSSEHQDAGPSFALPPRSMLLLGLIAFGVLFCEGVGRRLERGLPARDLRIAALGRCASGFAVFSLLAAAGRLTGDALALRLGALGGARRRRPCGAGDRTSGPEQCTCHRDRGVWLDRRGAGLRLPADLRRGGAHSGVAASTAIAAMATLGYTGFLVGLLSIGTLAERSQII